MPVLSTDNATIDYEVRGAGPSLVLINGMGFGRWGWFKQVPALSRRFRTVTFDVEGERDLAGGVGDLAGEVVALLDHLRIEKAHVLGASLGGFVAQELALKRPDLVDRLVLVCTSFGGRGPEAISLGALGRMFGWGSFTPQAATRRGLEAATSKVYRDRLEEEFERIVARRLADAPSLAAYYGEAMAGARFDASAAVGRITSPTLVIHGAEDRYVPIANAVALAGAIPGARLRVLEDAGHLVFIERPDAVNSEVIGFLEAREPLARERQAGPAVERPGSRLGRASRRLRGWAKKLLDRISR
ncbi:MAG: alpha/beta hydrolase [Actinomycetota bacterium]|nr:alpha/beta hydrolase [Actinomycetota bacterium]